jgi:hypothetical protein
MLSIFIRVLEIVFMIGAIGSALTILLTFAEDVIELWRSDEHKSAAAPPPAAAIDKAA